MILPSLFVALTSCVLSASPQDSSGLFDKAPPGVEEALRARIGKFYQAHVDGKFRLADQIVAEDSKDAFFVKEKKRYHSFEIVKITYSDNFTKAKAVVACDTDMAMMGQIFRVKVPLTSSWHLIDGEWYWHADPVPERKETPFGTMVFGPNAGANSGPGFPQGPRPETVQNAVKVDKSEVQLSSSEPATASVAVRNSMPGSVSLAVEYAGFPGLTIELDRKELKAGETATLRIACKQAKPAPRPPVVARLTVSPTNQVIPIRVTFAPPAK